MKKLIRLLTSRVTFVSVAILAQLILIVVLPSYFGPYYPYVYALGIVITTIAVIYLINKNTNPAYKIAWLVPIFLFPAFVGFSICCLAGIKPAAAYAKNCSVWNVKFRRSCLLRGNRKSCCKKFSRRIQQPHGNPPISPILSIALPSAIPIPNTCPPVKSNLS